jgi:hypothetical protein
VTNNVGTLFWKEEYFNHNDSKSLHMPDPPTTDTTTFCMWGVWELVEFLSWMTCMPKILLNCQGAKTMVELSVKSRSLHPVFGPAFTLYPLFQWYSQSKENLLNLSMKCWNSAFHAQGLKVANYNSCTGRSSENICSINGGAQEKGKTGWNSVYHQNCWEN